MNKQDQYLITYVYLSPRKDGVWLFHQRYEFDINEAKQTVTALRGDKEIRDVKLYTLVEVDY